MNAQLHRQHNIEFCMPLLLIYHACPPPSNAKPLRASSQLFLSKGAAASDIFFADILCKVVVLPYAEVLGR